MNQLLQRVVTAILLLAAVLVVFLLMPPFVAVVFVALMVVAAAWEWGGFLGFERPALRVAYVGLIMLLMAGSAWLLQGRVSLAAWLWSGLLWWGVAFVWMLRYPMPIRRDVGAVCGIMVLLPAWAGLLTILGSSARGSVYVLVLLSIIWAADIGAYFAGHQFGRTKLLPAVSPAKTWEGVAGGLLLAGVAAALAAVWLELPVAYLVPAGLSVAAISIVGDLTVSMFKRHAGLKDSGRLLPGHGGILDRVDSLTAGVPLFTLEAAWLGMIAN